MPVVDTKTREQIVKRVLTARKNRVQLWNSSDRADFPFVIDYGFAASPKS